MANYDVKGYIKDSNNYYFKDATARSSITTINNKIGTLPSSITGTTIGDKLLTLNGNIGNLSATGVTGNNVAAQITALNSKIAWTFFRRTSYINASTRALQIGGLDNTALFKYNEIMIAVCSPTLYPPAPIILSTALMKESHFIDTYITNEVIESTYLRKLVVFGEWDDDYDGNLLYANYSIYNNNVLTKEEAEIIVYVR